MNGDDGRAAPKEERQWANAEADVEADGDSDDRSGALKQFRTATSVSMSPELFEKLYLSPKNNIKGNLRATFGNPSPIGMAGFLLCLTPLSMDLMGWSGATGKGVANVGAYLFQGGILMNLGCVLEWILGNTFPAVVFGVYGTFWLAFAATLSPSYGAYAFYAPLDAKTPLAGLKAPGFNAGLGFWFLFMGFISLIFFICSLRTNVCFCVIFFSLVISFGLQTGGSLLSAADFAANAHHVHQMRVAAGAMTFVACWSGWYILFASLLASVDFPIQLRVGDLSTVIKGRQERTGRHIRRD
ncbi:GPR1/FUN34/yaaH family protein [Hirsutella rhossiliensis]|uniref:GPR1/FUN34/YaaH-class plasma membrane protein n=1 Tax=Hirsutella rhossiliensis TaxID=111463 RepID=A0A9P8N847_9HYPO|nr:uncharacterized protein HRG_01781 [Hirsutella rhossiliensis]KAH0966372.1 hypothetical protein HRG_01781 [Hirsutella rhossiliensis]